jgi:hypothetical protein
LSENFTSGIEEARAMAGNLFGKVAVVGSVLSLLLSAPQAVQASLLVGPSAADVLPAITTGNSDDGSTSFISLPFTFTAYGQPSGFGSGQTFNAVYMSTNGFLGIESPSLTIPNNLPGASTLLVAPFWDNLTAATGGTFRYNLSEPNQATFTWQNFSFANVSGSATFQTILLGEGNRFGYAPNSIIFSFGGITNADVNATSVLNISFPLAVSSNTPTLPGSPGLAPAQAITLSNRSFLFSPNSTLTGYTVTEIFPIPEPSHALGTVAIAFASATMLVRRRTMRRSG